MNFLKKAVYPKEHTWYSQGIPYTYEYGQLDLDYSLLKNEYRPEDYLTTEEKEEIAELFYAAAATVNMQFGHETSQDHKVVNKLRPFL